MKSILLQVYGRHATAQLRSKRFEEQSEVKEKRDRIWRVWSGSGGDEKTTRKDLKKKQMRYKLTD